MEVDYAYVNMNKNKKKLSLNAAILANISRSLALTTLFVLGACGDEAPGKLTAQEMWHQYATAFCERAFQCEDESPQPLSGEWSNVTTCTANVESQLNGDSAAVEASIEAGRIAWDEQDAGYCFAAVEDEITNSTCSEFWDPTIVLGANEPRCENLGVGLVANGDACTINDDCAGEGAQCSENVCTPQ